MTKYLNDPNAPSWYAHRAPKLTHAYPAWEIGPPEREAEPRPFITPGRVVLGLTIAALASLAWWLS